MEAILPVIVLLFMNGGVKENFNPTFKVHKLKLWKAKTKTELKKGLMFRKKPLPDNRGMLFNYNKYADHSFWMKNTFIPLDMIFLNKNDSVIGFVKNVEPHTLTSRTIGKPSYNAIEVNSGWVTRNNVNVGDKIRYTIQET